MSSRDVTRIVPWIHVYTFNTDHIGMWIGGSGVCENVVLIRSHIQTTTRRTLNTMRCSYHHTFVDKGPAAKPNFETFRVQPHHKRNARHIRYHTAGNETPTKRNH